MSMLLGNSAAVDRLGADVTQHFWQIKGRAPSQAELEEVSNMGMSSTWAEVDRRIAQYADVVAGATPFGSPGTVANSWLGDIGGTIWDIFKRGAGIPSTGPTPFPTAPTFPGGGGPPMLPSGPSGPGTMGFPGIPGVPMPSGGPGTMGMGGIISTIAKSGVVRQIARNIIPGIVAGVAGEWVYHKLQGWIFRKHRHRRMNVLNPHALSRANRRVVGFSHVARKTLRQLGYHVSSTRHVHGKAKSFGGHRKKR